MFTCCSAKRSPSSSPLLPKKPIRHRFYPPEVLKDILASTEDVATWRNARVVSARFRCFADAILTYQLTLRALKPGFSVGLSHFVGGERAGSKKWYNFNGNDRDFWNDRNGKEFWDDNATAAMRSRKCTHITAIVADSLFTEIDEADLEGALSRLVHIIASAPRGLFRNVTSFNLTHISTHRRDNIAVKDCMLLYKCVSSFSSKMEFIGIDALLSGIAADEVIGLVLQKAQNVSIVVDGHNFKFFTATMKSNVTSYVNLLVSNGNPSELIGQLRSLCVAWSHSPRPRWNSIRVSLKTGFKADSRFEAEMPHFPGYLYNLVVYDRQAELFCSPRMKFLPVLPYCSRIEVTAKRRIAIIKMPSEKVLLNAQESQKFKIDTYSWDYDCNESLLFCEITDDMLQFFEHAQFHVCHHREFYELMSDEDLSNPDCPIVVKNLPHA